MRSIIIFKIVTLLLLLFSSTYANEKLGVVKLKKNEKVVVFVVNLDCHGCVRKIESNIAYEKGVKDLKVSLEKKECEVVFREDRTSIEKLVEAFDKLGYKAEIKTDREPKKMEEKEEHHEDTH